MTEQTTPPDTGDDRQDPQVKKTDRRFEIHVDDSGRPAGFTLYLDHTAADGTVQRIFPHTEIRGEFGGQGLGSVLVRQALDRSIEEGVTIIPVCPYVKSWIQKHEGYAQHTAKPTPEHLQLISGR